MKKFIANIKAIFVALVQVNTLAARCLELTEEIKELKTELESVGHSVDQLDPDRIAEEAANHIDHDEIAVSLNYDKLAESVDVDELNVDHEAVAEKIDLNDLAGYFSANDIADELNVQEIARELDVDYEEFDYEEIARNMVREVFKIAKRDAVREIEAKKQAEQTVS